MQQLVSVGSFLGESNYHLQFTPKYRRDVFRDEAVKDLCRRSFEEVCTKMRIGMVACEFGPDHAHVFVANCKNYSVPQGSVKFTTDMNDKISLRPTRSLQPPSLVTLIASAFDSVLSLADAFISSH
ncbi:MAG: transposase [Nitrososphaerota archaeon]|nr:transposase [Nitrososphaerota archaeon]